MFYVMLSCVCVGAPNLGFLKKSGISPLNLGTMAAQPHTSSDHMCSCESRVVVEPLSNHNSIYIVHVLVGIVLFLIWLLLKLLLLRLLVCRFYYNISSKYEC